MGITTEFVGFIPKSLVLKSIVLNCLNFNKFIVSKETVVLRRWGRSKQKFGFIKRVDKGEITTEEVKLTP